MAHQSNEPSRASPPSAIAARLAMGYIALQAVCVATKLGIAVLLSKGALTSSEIAQSTETRPTRCIAYCARWRPSILSRTSTRDSLDAVFSLND